ncbi:family 16 glycosylhydrolase [Portibacter marinus]|uniref:family 16 glycosylhydrolase n=1 Tax=Portibacter marinus TaxID=2898660 RepID=UPI001F1DDC07|nr:family 16 glycosylhydrolase [Portibacter marinus]
MRTKLPIVIVIFSFNIGLYGQLCSGAEIYTQESYQYGRFEVSMQSAQGDGIISSFFLYNKDAGCDWPANNNEIDFEMTGNNNLIYMTTHHPGESQPWFYGDTLDFPDSPHAGLNTYVIEWEPGIVRWFINGTLVYVQDDPAALDLKYPMSIFMNIWPADFEDWVGVWDPSVMPRSASYDYVKYYRYSPDNGNTGTDNHFTLEWEDEFDLLDTSRWVIADFKKLSNSYCDFSKSSVSISNSKLILSLKESQPDNTPIPVTFSVNMASQNLNSSDKVYLNGTFNEWCGACNEMQMEGDVWSLTLPLSPGNYEYLFTVNGWDEIGNAPAGSSCDYYPCDEFNNYGFTLSSGESDLDLGTFCWSECSKCTISSTSEENVLRKKELIGVFDVNGRKVESVENQLLFYIYSDGSVEKKLIFEY